MTILSGWLFPWTVFIAAIISIVPVDGLVCEDCPGMFACEEGNITKTCAAEDDVCIWSLATVEATDGTFPMDALHGMRKCTTLASVRKYFPKIQVGPVLRKYNSRQCKTGRLPQPFEKMWGMFTGTFCLCNTDRCNKVPFENIKLPPRLQRLEEEKANGGDGLLENPNETESAATGEPATIGESVATSDATKTITTPSSTNEEEERAARAAAEEEQRTRDADEERKRAKEAEKERKQAREAEEEERKRAKGAEEEERKRAKNAAAHGNDRGGSSASKYGSRGKSSAGAGSSAVVGVVVAFVVIGLVVAGVVGYCVYTGKSDDFIEDFHEKVEAVQAKFGF